MMLLSAFHNILFQQKRPWILQERKVVEDGKSYPAKNDIEMFSGVCLPEPSGKAEFAYTSLINTELGKALHQIISDVNELHTEIDKIYYLEKAERQTQDLVQSADRKQQKIADDAVSTFVLNYLQLTLINLVVDLRLRYEQFLSEKETNPRHISLMLIDRPLPKSALFYHHPAYYEKNLQKLLETITNGDMAREMRTAKIISFLKELAYEIQSAPPELYSSADIEPIVHHAENVIFLIKFDASFIHKSPESLLRPDYCIEWLDEQKRDVLEQDEFKEIEKAYLAAIELENSLAGCRDFFEGMALSMIRIWAKEFKALAGIKGAEAVDIGTVTADKRNKNREDFTNRFIEKYVTREEVANVLGTTTETVQKHIKGNRVRVLKLGNKRWFIRADIEKLLDEHVE